MTCRMPETLEMSWKWMETVFSRPRTCGGFALDGVRPGILLGKKA